MGATLSTSSGLHEGDEDEDEILIRMDDEEAESSAGPQYQSVLWYIRSSLIRDLSSIKHQ